LIVSSPNRFLRLSSGPHPVNAVEIETSGAAAVLMSRVISHELEILGSHGMQAHRYSSMLAMIESGKLQPEHLIGRPINLEQSIEALVNMDKFEGTGMTVITDFAS
jgi:alcohol dehydrogenase